MGGYCQGLVLVLQDEADGIGFHALGDAFAFVHVEEADAFEEFLLGGVGYLFNLGKGDVVVENESEVAAHLRVFRHFGVLYFFGGIVLENQGPVDVGIEDLLLAVHAAEGVAADAAKGAEGFVAVAVLKTYAFGEIFLGCRNGLEAGHVDTHTVQDVKDMSLEIVEVGSDGGDFPVFGLHVAIVLSTEIQVFQCEFFLGVHNKWV